MHYFCYRTVEIKIDYISAHHYSYYWFIVCTGDALTLNCNASDDQKGNEGVAEGAGRGKMGRLSGHLVFGEVILACTMSSR